MQRKDDDCTHSRRKPCKFGVRGFSCLCSDLLFVRIPMQDIYFQNPLHHLLLRTLMVCRFKNNKYGLRKKKEKKKVWVRIPFVPQNFFLGFVCNA